MDPSEAAAILGVSPSATEEDIKKAHRARARLVHPDRYGAGSDDQQLATDEFQRITTARDTMLNPVGPPTGDAEESWQYEPPSDAVMTFERVEHVNEILELSAVAGRRSQRFRFFFWTAVGSMALTVGVGGPVTDGTKYDEMITLPFFVFLLAAIVAGRKRRHVLAMQHLALLQAAQAANNNAYLYEAIRLAEMGVSAPLEFHRSVIS